MAEKGFQDEGWYLLNFSLNILMSWVLVLNLVASYSALVYPIQLQHLSVPQLCRQVEYYLVDLEKQKKGTVKAFTW